MVLFYRAAVYRRLAISKGFFMKREFYFIFALLFAWLVTNATAQDVQPTPVPVPSPIASPTPVVPDKQNVQPENLQGVPQIAPNYSSEDRSLPDLGRVGVDMTEQKSLALREAISMALENNKDIEVTRQNVKIAEFDLQAARGAYEPRFSGQSYYEHTKTPVFSFFAGGPNFSLTQSNVVANGGINGLVNIGGGSFSAIFNNTRNTTNNIFTSVNPTYTSNLSFAYTQPILRGRHFDQTRRTIEIAKKNLSLTDTQFRQRTIDIITNVQRAYWDLTYALRNLQVQRDGVKDAKDQLEHNKRLVEEGQLAPIDVVAAETQVANFEQAVYDALNTVGQAENTLKNLIAPNKNDLIWAQSLTPTDNVDLEPPATTLQQALDAALQNRPELELNDTQKALNEIDKKFYREQTRPQVDFVASYTLTGAAGTLNPNVINPIGNTTPTINSIIDNVNQITAQNYQNLPLITPLTVTATPPLPDYLNGGYGSAMSNLFQNRYPTFRVGVQFNLPLFGDKTAHAQLGRSLVEGDRLQTQREQLEQTIQVDVRNALQALRTAEARLRAAAISRENSVKQYESEQRKLDAGQSDVYKVLERQTALTQARSNELRAQTELNKAIADLQRATGNSLKANNVEARLRK
jgi:HAE1 family hydrophobic/amphiphilic exporter-1